MELSLNLAWILLAALMFCLWARFGVRTGSGRREQFVALALLIAILFPVISVTDDLLSAQSPAETESCLRRDHGTACPHSIFPAIAGLPATVFAEPCIGILCVAVPGVRFAPVVANPALAPILNRPPPAA